MLAIRQRKGQPMTIMFIIRQDFGYKDHLFTKPASHEVAHSYCSMGYSFRPADADRLQRLGITPIPVFSLLEARNALSERNGCMNCISALTAELKAQEAKACTCETYGTCGVCRPEGEDGYATHAICAWCEKGYDIEDMFRVGKDAQDRYVCGPDCPKRPTRVCQHFHVVTIGPNLTLDGTFKLMNFTRWERCVKCHMRRKVQFKGVHEGEWK